MTKQSKPTVIEGEVVEKPSRNENKKAQQFVSEQMVAIIIVAAVLIVGGYFAYPYVGGWLSDKFETQQPVITAEVEIDDRFAGRIDSLEQKISALEAHRTAVADHPAQQAEILDRITVLEERVAGLTLGGGQEAAAEDPRVTDLLADIQTLKTAMAELMKSRTPAQPGFAAALAELAPPLYRGSPYAGQLERVHIYILDMAALDQSMLSGPLAVLGKSANAGIVDVTVLRQEFQDAVIEALKTEGLSPDAGWWERTWAKIKGQVVIRNSDGSGSTLDSVLREAEAYLAAGEVEKALGILSALPEEQAAPFAGWIAKASVRVEALAAYEAMTNFLASQRMDSGTMH